MHKCVYLLPQNRTSLTQYVALVIPAAYLSAKHVITPGYGNLMALADKVPLTSDPDEDVQKGLLIISRGTAIILLGVFVAYLVFQLKTHTFLFTSKRQDHQEPDGHPGEAIEEETPKMSMIAAGVGYVPCRRKGEKSLTGSQSSSGYRRNVVCCRLL